MRTAWTPHAEMASPDKGEAFVSGPAGGQPVTINQFHKAVINAAMQASADLQKAAYIVAWRRCFAPT